MKDLADGIVQHVGWIQPGIGGLNFCRVVSLVIGLKMKLSEKVLPSGQSSEKDNASQQINNCFSNQKNFNSIKKIFRQNSRTL